MSKQCGRCGERAALRRPKTQEQVSKSMLPYDLLIFACNCMLYIRNSAIMQKLLFLAAQLTESENFTAAAAAAAAAMQSEPSSNWQLQQHAAGQLNTRSANNLF